jgi:hypothetical protein
MSTSYKGQTSYQGKGGLMQGRGSIDMGDGLNIPITVTFNTGGSDEIVQEVHKVGNAAEATSTKTGKLTDASKEAEKASQKQLSGYRTVTWDLMLLGRSASIVNNTFLGHNQILKDMIGIVYGVSAVMRTYLVIRDLSRVLSLGNKAAEAAELTVSTAHAAAIRAQAAAYTTLGANQAATTVATSAQTTAVWGQVAAYAALAGVTGGGSIAAGAVGGAVKGTLGGFGASMFPQAASGGFVGQTGLAIIHKGETIIPKGGPAMTMININMQTGGISSNIDVNNLLNAMASKMAIESRRRSGK